MKVYVKPELEIRQFATNGADVLGSSGFDNKQDDIIWFTEVGK